MPWRGSERPDPALALDPGLAHYGPALALDPRLALDPGLAHYRPAGTRANPRCSHGHELRAFAPSIPPRSPREPAADAHRDPSPSTAPVRDPRSARRAPVGRGSQRTVSAGLSGLTPRFRGAPHAARSADASDRTRSTV